MDINEIKRVLLDAKDNVKDWLRVLGIAATFTFSSCSAQQKTLNDVIDLMQKNLPVPAEKTIDYDIEGMMDPDSTDPYVWVKDEIVRIFNQEWVGPNGKTVAKKSVGPVTPGSIRYKAGMRFLIQSTRKYIDMKYGGDFYKFMEAIKETHFEDAFNDKFKYGGEGWGSFFLMLRKTYGSQKAMPDTLNQKYKRDKEALSPERIIKMGNQYLKGQNFLDNKPYPVKR